jgi:hypothetical protein
MRPEQILDMGVRGGCTQSLSVVIETWATQDLERGNIKMVAQFGLSEYALDSWHSCLSLCVSGNSLSSM